MLRRVALRLSRSAGSDKSHLAGITPKTHENRGPSQPEKLGGQLSFDPKTGTLRTAVGGVTDSAADITTHTGQRYDDGDFRLNRFIGGKKKQISQNWAIDLIAEEPVIPINARSVMCDGQHGGIPKEQGHPRVWINLDDGQVHECMYCGLRYQKQAAYDAAQAALAAQAAQDE